MSVQQQEGMQFIHRGPGTSGAHESPHALRLRQSARPRCKPPANAVLRSLTLSQHGVWLPHDACVQLAHIGPTLSTTYQDCTEHVWSSQGTVPNKRVDHYTMIQCVDGFVQAAPQEI